MKIVIRFIICLMCTLSSLSFLHAETTETVAKYRASFERRMNQQLDDEGAAARKLRLNYIDALKKLNVELRRAENLKGVVQVMAEIEALEDGEEAEGLPPGADYRIKNLRNQWDRGMSEIRAGSNRKLNETVKIYLKALDTEKRRLTRSGKIKDALLIEEEEKRVRELPEVAAVLKANAPEGAPAAELGGDLALASKGARAVAPNFPNNMIDGKTEHSEKGGFSFGAIPARLEVDLGKAHELYQVRVLLYEGDKRKYGYKLSVSADGRKWDQVASERRAQGWQKVNLDKVMVRYIRINGLSNSANQLFHVVEVEAYGAR
ncbi:MAG: discoidin domain-containing protein [Verrucomicrobiota bacterium]|nr:discoidin domain-containing protein [Verrucomicrobiota bacterium]